MTDTKWYDYQRAVWESKVPWPHRGDLLALAFHASADGEGFPGNETLANETLASTKTVRNHTADLEHHGLINKELRPGRSSIYRLNLEAIAAWNGGKLDAYRKRTVNFKKDRDGKPLATPESVPVAGGSESPLPPTMESRLPGQGGKPLADITSKGTTPWTTSNKGNQSESSGTMGDDSPSGPAGGLPGLMTPERRAEIRRMVEEEKARLAAEAAAYQDANRLVPDSTHVPSGQCDATPEASPSAPRLTLVKNCDKCGESPAKSNKTTGGAYWCATCAPHVWNVA